MAALRHTMRSVCSSGPRARAIAIAMAIPAPRMVSASIQTRLSSTDSSSSSSSLSPSPSPSPSSSPSGPPAAPVQLTLRPLPPWQYSDLTFFEQRVYDRQGPDFPIADLPDEEKSYITGAAKSRAKEARLWGRDVGDDWYATRSAWLAEKPKLRQDFIDTLRLQDPGFYVAAVEQRQKEPAKRLHELFGVHCRQILIERGWRKPLSHPPGEQYTAMRHRNKPTKADKRRALPNATAVAAPGEVPPVRRVAIEGSWYERTSTYYERLAADKQVRVDPAGAQAASKDVSLLQKVRTAILGE